MSIQTYPLATAKTLSKKWAENQHTYFAQGNEFNAVTISKETVEKILANLNVVDIRIHFGLNEYNEIKPFAVGVDANNNEIIPATAEGSAFVYNFIRPCPPFCNKKKFWDDDLEANL